MSETGTDRPRPENLLDDRDGVTIVVMVALLGGLAAGWAGRGLLAGEGLAEQTFLLPVIFGLGTALYAQAVGM
jgi:hypothetical protein